MLIKIKRRGNIPADSLYVDYRVENSQRKRLTLILLPGGPGGDHSIYLKQIDVFYECMDVVVFDPRGCGKSTLANSECYSMDVYIDDVEAIRRQLELDSIVILGTSYGSMAAQGYAIKYGYSIDLKGLILVAGAPSYQFIDDARIELERLGTSEQRDAFKKLLEGKIKTDDQLRDYFKTMASVYSFIEEKEKGFHAAKRDVRYNAQAALAGFGPSGFLRSFDWRANLTDISCPTLIIVGEYDWINSPKQAKEMSKLIPNNSLSIILESGHFVWVDKKETYLDIVKNFLRQECPHARCSNFRAKL